MSKAFGGCRPLRTLLLAATAITALAEMPQAQAQQPAATQGNTVKFNIPSQSLTSALTAFARQSGVRLAYPASLTAGKSAPALNGRLSREAALTHLLGGSGLTYSFTGANTATISGPGVGGNNAAATVPGAIALDTIDVQGSGGATEGAWGPVDGIVAKQSATGTKTDTPILETPQTINVVTREEMDRRSPETVAQTLSYTPGVTVDNAYGLRAQAALIRGPWEAPLFIDGLSPNTSAFQWATWEPFGLERVEVLKGPASVLYGQAAPGGIINAVSKRPTNEPFREVSVGIGSFNKKETTVDFGGPLAEDRSLLYRFTGLYMTRDDQMDYVGLDKIYLAPALTWRPTASTEVTILSRYQKEQVDGWTGHYYPADGIAIPNPNGRITPHTFFGEPGFDRNDTEQFTIGYDFRHDFTDALRFRQNLRFETRKADGFSSFLNGFDFDRRTMLRSAYGYADDTKGLAVDTNLLARVSTGPLEHKILFGLDYKWGDADEKTFNGTMNPIDPFNPVYGNANIQYWPGVDLTYGQRQTGAYIQDQIAWDGWRLTLGGRYDWATSSSDGIILENNSLVAESRSDAAFTGRAGLAYVFDNGLVPYVSYSTSFNPQAGGNLQGIPWKPTEGKQFEVGLKYEPKTFNGLFTISYFDLVQENELLPHPTIPGELIQSGKIPSKGIEVEAKFNPLKNIDITATYTYSDVETPLGDVMPDWAKHSASAWVNYSFDSEPLDGLSLGAGVRYARFTETIVYDGQWNEYPYYPEPTTLVDASLTYDFSKKWEELKGLRLNVNATNLFDEEYNGGCGGPNCWGFRPLRTVTGRLSYRW